MRSPNTPQHRPVKFLDVKIFIAALSVAVTAGFWNVLSFNTSPSLTQKPENDPTNTPDIPSVQHQDFPRMPTLVTLVEINPIRVDLEAEAQNNQDSNRSMLLRSVTAPTQVVVQKVKPLFDQSQPVQNAGGGSTRASKSVTKTRSSR